VLIKKHDPDRPEGGDRIIPWKLILLATTTRGNWKAACTLHTLSAYDIHTNSESNLAGIRNKEED